MNSLLDPQESKEIKEYLPELVGEGKKFRTPEDLAKGKHQADQHISTLERENNELREWAAKLADENKAKASWEELIDRMNKQPSESNPTHHADDVRKPEFDESKIKSLVSSTVSEMERARREQDNLMLVRNKLQEYYGDSYQNVLQTKMKEFGLNDVDTMAKTSPQALLQLMKPVQSNEQYQAPPRSTMTSSSMKPPQKRTWTYYQELKKANPKLYFDKDTALQMVRDANELGKDFNDGDFYRFAPTHTQY